MKEATLRDSRIVESKENALNEQIIKLQADMA